MSRRKRISKGSWATDVHEVLGGKAQVFRVAQSGDVYQFRMWVSEEKKYVRESLRTRDLTSAIHKAESRYVEVRSDVSSGKKLFGATLDELSEKYLAWRKLDIGERITAGRFTTIKSQIKHLLTYKSPSLKLGELTRNSLFDYEQYRFAMGAKPVTVRNEQATINQMAAFAYREGYLSFDKFLFREIRLKETGRRAIFTTEEYELLVKYLRKYVSKNACPNETERRERLIVRDFILLASNSLLRFGELTQLRWGDIPRTFTQLNGRGQETKLVEINVRAETSKVRSSRRVICRGGQYVDRLKKNCKYTDAGDLVFSRVDSRIAMGRRKWDYHWRNLMLGIGIEDYSERKLTFYSLRHFGITARVRAGVSYPYIADQAGTSAVVIEEHYSQFDDGMRVSSAVKSYEIDEFGIITEY